MHIAIVLFKKKLWFMLFHFRNFLIIFNDDNDDDDASKKLVLACAIFLHQNNLHRMNMIQANAIQQQQKLEARYAPPIKIFNASSFWPFSLFWDSNKVYLALFFWRYYLLLLQKLGKFFCCKVLICKNCCCGENVKQGMQETVSSAKINLD